MSDAVSNLRLSRRYLDIYVPKPIDGGEAPLAVMFWVSVVSPVMCPARSTVLQIFGGGWSLGDGDEFGWYATVAECSWRWSWRWSWWWWWW